MRIFPGIFTGIQPFHLAGGMVFQNALILEIDRAVGRLIHAGDRIERGRLTGAVGTDERNDLALMDLHREVVHCHHAAELHGDIL